MPFNDYTRAGFATELLPILPHDARINRASPSFADLEGSKGKVPGRKVAGGTWYGFAEWSRHVPSGEEISKWADWGAGIGLQGRKYPGLDIDVEDREVADAIETTALLEIGLAPARFGRGSRRLLVYAGAGLKKRRLAFRLPGRSSDAVAGHLGDADDGQGRPGQDQVVLDQERAEDLGVVHAVELLGEGQQYVVEGIHPKTGQPYAWRGPGLAEIGSEALTPVTDEEIDAFFAALEWAIVNIYDGEIVSSTGSDRQDASRGAVAQELLLAPSIAAVEEALGSIDVQSLPYDPWVKVLRATYAATGGGDDGYALALEWALGNPENTEAVVEAKWRSFEGDDHRVGYRELCRMAGETFNAAAHDFEPYDASPVEEAPLSDSIQNMWSRYAWIETAKRAVELETGDMLDQEQFEFRIPPSEAGRSAWRIFKENPAKRTSYKQVTCRFGEPREVVEDLPDLQGRCFNLWRAPYRARPLPDKVTDEEVDPYLALAACVMPIEAEREHVLNYLAFLVQRPNVKINHALVLGSRQEGIGKDTLIEPVRCALGSRYVKPIDPDDLLKPFSDWLIGTKVAIVEEMHNFERRAVMNKLKPLAAAPPLALGVSQKFKDKFFIPNVLSLIFFTNEDDALTLSRGDRRYFVTWNDADPQPQEYYDRVWAWLEAGGVEKVARWLMQRDVSAFNAKGRAPMTEAKAAMRRMARPPLQEWLEDSIEQEEGVFARDLLVIDEIQDAVPDHVRYRGQPVSGHKLAKVLAPTGAKIVSERVRLDAFSGPRRIWAVRKAAVWEGQPTQTIREMYVKQKADADHSAREKIGKVLL